MSRGEELFERIKARNIAAIDDLIADAAAEQLFLDFKGSANTGLPRTLPTNDARHLAAAISGFGNAEGGIIVWGIDCRVDRVSGTPNVRKAPLADAMTFRARLEETLSRSSTPPHPLVENFVVLDGAGPGGYVVTLVPKAEFGPIRAITDGTDKYYIRAGDSFVSIPHDALAGLFGRKPRAVIWPQLTSHPVRRPGPLPGNGRVHVVLGIGLYNKGPVLAARPYVSVHPISVPTQETFHINAASNSFELRRSVQGNVQVVGREGLVIAPGGLEDLCSISLLYSAPVTSELRIEITVGTDSSNFEQFQLYASADDLTQAHAAALQGQSPQSIDLLHAKEALPHLT